MSAGPSHPILNESLLSWLTGQGWEELVVVFSDILQNHWTKKKKQLKTWSRNEFLCRIWCVFFCLLVFFVLFVFKKVAFYFYLNIWDKRCYFVWGSEMVTFNQDFILSDKKDLAKDAGRICVTLLKWSFKNGVAVTVWSHLLGLRSVVSQTWRSHPVVSVNNAWCFKPQEGLLCDLCSNKSVI